MQPGTDIKRLKLLATFLSMLIVGTLAVATAVGFAAVGRINTVQGDLDRFHAGAETKGLHLAQIRSAFGYGGLIHKFKNFVLRQDDRLVTAIEGDIRTLRAAAVGFEAVGVSDEEAAALTKLRTVIDKYEMKLEVAKRSIRSGLSPTETDHRVKVDDRPALEAIAVLERAWLGVYGIDKQSLWKSVKRGTAAVRLGLWLVPVLALIAVAIIWFHRRLLIEISNSVQAERHREQRLRLVVDNAVSGIITIDGHGTIESFNPAAERLFGYGAEDVVGRNVKMLMPEPDRSAHDGYLGNYLRSGEAKIIGIGREVEGLRKDGTIFPLELGISELIIDGNRIFTGVVTDITERRRAADSLKKAHDEMESRVTERTKELIEEMAERRQAERALRESEERFRAVVDNSPTAISLKDTEGRYLLANKRYEEWFGISREDIAGKTCYDLYPEERAHIISAQDRKALATGAVSERTAKRVFADGTTHTSLITKFPIPGSDGKPVAICGIHTDITERIVLQEKLAAAQKMEALGQLTGGVAHEFNNLLMIITANLQLLEDEIEGMEKPTRRVQKALKSAFKGGELTQHLLSYVGRQMLSPKVVDVNTFVADTVHMLRPMVGETIAIETVMCDDVWPVSVDPGGLDSALLNLVVNARDALPDGGKITIETANLRLDEAAAARRPYKVVPGDYVMLAVVDNGTGMTTDVAERAFDPFFTTKDVGKGTGLGLSMVFGFVRRQSGGYIDIESAPRRGTTVRLYLPRVQAAAGKTPEPAGATEEPVGGGATVLVVEDNAEVLGATVELLEKLGYRVFYAINGRDALTLSEKEDRIDLLLTDVVIPGGMNGVDLARAVQRTSPTTRVVFMSGYPDGAAATEGVSESGAPLLHKPFKTGELARVINEVLEGSTMCA
ncbi:MAG: PAS domain S-box protein [Proteobacteria bacterium]|nr:PAS domain S-box protein [Pseudomonadota bacterium]